MLLLSSSLAAAKSGGGCTGRYVSLTPCTFSFLVVVVAEVSVAFVAVESLSVVTIPPLLSAPEFLRRLQCCCVTGTSACITGLPMGNRNRDLVMMVVPQKLILCHPGNLGGRRWSPWCCGVRMKRMGIYLGGAVLLLLLLGAESSVSLSGSLMGSRSFSSGSSLTVSSCLISSSVRSTSVYSPVFLEASGFAWFCPRRSLGCGSDGGR